MGRVAGGSFHPPAPTEPCVTVSRHTALLIQSEAAHPFPVGEGKDDRIDATLAAQFALRQDSTKLPTPRADGKREALQILLGTRMELTGLNTAQNNKLKALLLRGDDVDRELARGTMTQDRLLGLTLRERPSTTIIEILVRHDEIHRLATSMRALFEALKVNLRQLRLLVDEVAPTLQTLHGVGPVNGAQVLVSWSHPGRVRNDAAFAALAGTCPLPASSGRTTRYRLNRGSDRSLNRAIHMITMTRWCNDPRTKAYIDKRRADGKTDREIRRILKRYITRELYKTLRPA
jgi:transposase